MSAHNKIFNKNYSICLVLNVHSNASKHVPLQVPFSIAFECDTFTPEFLTEEQPKFKIQKYQEQL